MLDTFSLDDLVLAGALVCPDFTPASRFAHKTFEQFEPQHPSQVQALCETKAFIENLTSARSRSWPWQKTPIGRGLYLDGGYGVGKTHLLAAAYTACKVDLERKAYLSFSDLVYAIGMLGVTAFSEKITKYKLYCIDEFELDDPGNTTLVYWFLSHVFSKGAWVVTTSNTLPEAQGQGRFNAPKFKREIRDLANYFKVTTMNGPDYRQRAHTTSLLSEQGMLNLEALEEVAKPKVSASWSDLFTFLRAHHPFRYDGLVRQIGALYLHEVKPIDHSDDALRFVHFIDKLYEFDKVLQMFGECNLTDLFASSYINGAFAKKYYRCVSRVSELLNNFSDMSDR